MHSCIPNYMRTRICKLHAAQSMIEHLLHLHLHAALHVWHNIMYSYNALQSSDDEHQRNLKPIQIQ